VFFGRAREIAHAVDQLKAAAERKTPFLLIVGAGGVGKSSLVHAGIVPRLTAPGVVADVDVWRVALLRPGARPLDALAEVRALDRGREGEGAARAALLLVVDPLDDLFAADVTAAERAAFAAALRQLVASERVWVVATLRAAFYEACLAESDLKALKDAGAGFDLAAPDAAALAEIVRKPAQAAGLVFETDATGTSLDEVLLRDAAGADALPALQLTLQCLFAERQLIGQERRLTFAAYAAMGGAAGAIEHTAEAAFAELSDAERQALPPLLRRLVVRADEPGSGRVSGARTPKEWPMQASVAGAKTFAIRWCRSPMPRPTLGPAGWSKRWSARAFFC
jgi:eukaryotic-like serine/threonine-protein kinase